MELFPFCCIHEFGLIYENTFEVRLYSHTLFHNARVLKLYCLDNVKLFQVASVLSIRPNISNNNLSIINIYVFSFIMHVISYWCRGRHGHGCMVVGFTTTYAFDAYHHWCCGFDSAQGEVYNIMW